MRRLLDYGRVAFAAFFTVAFAARLAGCEDSRLFKAEIPDASVTLPDSSVQVLEDASVTLPDAGSVDSGDPVILPGGPDDVDLWVKLIWNPGQPDTSDVDLHLMNPHGLEWFDSPDDCYFGNKHPTWDGMASTSPTLDHDDVNGNGPEETVIPHLPKEEEGHPYTVGVHYFGANGHQGASVVYVQIQCLGTTVQVGPVDLYPGDLWRVADVEFTPINVCVIVPKRTQSGELVISKEFNR